MPEDPPYKYLVIQRCLAFGTWPNDLLHRGDHHAAKIRDGTRDYDVVLQLYVKTYDQTKFDIQEGEQFPQMGNLVHDDRRKGHFQLGDMELLPTGAETEMRVEFRHAERGELDFVLGIATGEPIPSDALERALSPFLTAVVTGMAFKLDDRIINTAPLQIYRVLENGQMQFATSVKVRVEDRKVISSELIESTAPEILATLFTKGREGGNRIAAAARRYENSMRERDYIDRFSDLWEACEFIAQGAVRGDGRKVGGKVDSKIAYILGRAIGVEQDLLLKNVVGPLYNTRKDLVHNAVDNPEELAEQVSALEEVAEHLIRFSLCLGASRTMHIEKMLAR